MIDEPVAPSHIMALVKWDQLRHDVEQARTIDDLKGLRDKADALRQYSKRQKESIDMQNKFAEITLRCRRRMGEMLQEMPKEPGKRTDLTSSLHATRLQELGITRSDSSRCQAIANLPEEEFEQFIAKTKARHEEITTGGCVKLAKRHKQQEQGQEVIDEIDDVILSDVYHCPIAEFHQYVEANTLDAIITDPPYPREYLPVYTDLAKFAAYALKPGGSLIAMVGQSYLPDILDMLREHLTYHWLSCYYVPGTTTKQWQRNIGISWKPLLWFVKGEYEGPWRKDVIRADDIFIGNGKDKNHHKWGQPVEDMKNIIERFTQPDQFICDPFVGGGSTAVAALLTGRRFVGCDIDEKCVQTTIQQVRKALQEREEVAAD